MRSGQLKSRKKSAMRILLLIMLLQLCSCRNYDSAKYISAENEAINDLIHKMIDLEYMVKHNNLDTNNLKIFFISVLGNEICEIYKPDGYIVGEDSIMFSEEEVNKRKDLYEIEFEKYLREFEFFAPLTKGKIKERKFDYQFKFSNLKVELVSENADFFNPNLNSNEFGILSVSRVVFNRSFDKGNLSYGFGCGPECMWQYNVEISKIDGKWIISKYLSGIIA